MGHGGGKSHAIRKWKHESWSWNGFSGDREQGDRRRVECVDPSVFSYG